MQGAAAPLLILLMSWSGLRGDVLIAQQVVPASTKQASRASYELRMQQVQGVAYSGG